MTNQVVTHLKTKDDVTSELHRIEGVFHEMGHHITEKFAEVGKTIVAAFAVEKIVEFGKRSVEAFAEAESAEAKYNAMRKANNESTGIATEEMKELAMSLQETTKQHHAHTIGVAAMLLRYENLTEEVFPRTIKLAVDMAEIFGSLDHAANMLGRGLNDPINAARLFKMAGVQLSEEIQDQIKTFKEEGEVVKAQELIFAELEKRFGGLGEAMGNTLAGKMAKLNNEFEEVKETIGESLVPAIEEVIPKLMRFAKEFKAAMAIPIPTPGAGGGDKGPRDVLDPFRSEWWTNMLGGVANIGAVSNDASSALFGGRLGGGSQMGATAGGGGSSWAEYWRHFTGTLSGQREEGVNAMTARGQMAGVLPRLVGPPVPKVEEVPDPFAAYDPSKKREPGTMTKKEEEEFEKTLAELREIGEKKMAERVKNALDRDKERRKADDDYYEKIFKDAEEAKKKKEGEDKFTSTIEDMFGVHRRIQEAAASKPEDKVIAANAVEQAKNREVFGKAVDAVDKVKDAIEKGRLSPSPLGVEEGLA